MAPWACTGLEQALHLRQPLLELQHLNALKSMT
jgi:hypothetical protein